MQQRKLIIIIIFSIVLSSFFKTKAQEPFYRIIGNQRDLPSPIIYSINTDKNGLIYVGCDEGLFSFNGIKFIRLPFKNNFSNAVTSILFDENNNVWCRNFSNQLFYQQSDSLILLNELDSILNGENIIELKYRNNKFFVASKSKIIEINSNLKKCSVIFELDEIESFEVTKNNKLFVVSNQGFIYNVSEKKEISIKQIAKRLFLASNSDSIFVIEKIAGTGNIFVLKNNIIVPFMFDENLKSKHVNNFEYYLGRLFVYTDKGLFYYDKNNNVNLLKNYITTSSVFDFQGGLWVATINDGLINIPELKTKHYKYTDQTKYSCVSVNNYGLFIGTKSGKIIWQDTIGNTHTINTGKTNEIEFIHYDSINKTVYSSQGYYNFKTKKFTSLYFGKKLQIDSNGNLLFALHNSARYKKSTNKKFWLDKWKIDSVINENNLYYIIKNKRARTIYNNEKKNNLIIGFTDGLFFYDLNLEQNIKDRFGNNIFATDIAQIKNGYAVGTTKSGVIVLDDNLNEIFRYSEERGLSNNSSKKVKAYKNYLFVLTSIGFDAINLNTNEIINIKNLAGFDELSIVDFDIFNDLFYVITNKGLITLPLESIDVNIPFLFKFKNLTTNAKFSIDSSGIVFPYDNEKIIFNFQILSYKGLNKEKLFYKIFPIDSVYRKFDLEDAKIELLNLREGNYELILKSASKNFTYSFSVKSPFWKTIWFYICCLLFIGLIILLTIKITQNFLKNKHQSNERYLLSQLTALRAQMNPHFLYNVLNSVQGLIYSNKIKEAANYINKFSMHLRSILEITKKNEITIKDEVDALNLYLDLEKLRFGNDFTFEITHDKDILLTTVIPSMIIQPFVENAVKHGLLHKQGQKNISISFKLLNQKLVVIINDNGIGRKAAEIINNKQINKPKSFATQAIENRIDLINLTKKQKIELMISDNYENNNALGTSVIISIPIINE